MKYTTDGSKQETPDLLELDITLTNPKYESKATPRVKVLKMWRGIIKSERELPDDWMRSKGMVMSIDKLEQINNRIDRHIQPPSQLNQ